MNDRNVIKTVSTENEDWDKPYHKLMVSGLKEIVFLLRVIAATSIVLSITILLTQG